MRLLSVLFLFRSVSFNYGQVSHADLLQDLLKDMTQAVSDSLDMDAKQVYLHFEEAAPYTEYLNDLQRSRNTELTQQDTVRIQPKILDLSIHRNPNASSRNSTYLRKLKLTVQYERNGIMEQWQGGLSDPISDSHLQMLVDEPFPTPVTGDYLEDQPSSIIVTLVSALTLSLIAALYFIRT